MISELEIAIENLYQTFKPYRYNPEMSACPCCVSSVDQAKLRTNQLRELEESDLSKYAFKAMTTWGDVDDFKHFLPRIFELLSTTNFVEETFVVLGKLDYGSWTFWDKNEQESINAFLISWWKHIIRNKTYFDHETFIEIYKIQNDIDVLLSVWELNFRDNSYMNYVLFVQEYYSDLVDEKRNFKDVKKKDVKRILTWITNNSETLETGFYHFDETNKEKSEIISNTHYLYERINEMRSKYRTTNSKS